MILPALLGILRKKSEEPTSGLTESELYAYIDDALIFYSEYDPDIELNTAVNA